MVAIFWIIIIACAALAWFWIAAAMVVAMGITGFGMVKAFGRKKYITGLITMAIGIAGMILVYLYMVGDIVL